MKRLRIPRTLAVSSALVVLGGVAGFLPASWREASPRDRQVTITARKYAYEPAVLEVNRGDRVHIHLVAQDVTHGFYLEGYDLDAKVRPQDPTFWVRHPSRKDDYQQTQEISFVANRAGKFHYRCSITCGYMHPFMQGEFIVRPNYLYPTSMGLLLGLAAAVLVSFRSSEPKDDRKRTATSGTSAPPNAVPGDIA